MIAKLRRIVASAAPTCRLWTADNDACVLRWRWFWLTEREIFEAQR